MVIGVVVATAVARAVVADRIRSEVRARPAPPLDVVVERREVADPRGPISLLRYADGRVAAVARVRTELEGGPHARASGPRVLTRDATFDRVWRVRRGAGGCTSEVRREILAARPLAVTIAGGELTVVGSGSWCREGALVEAVRALRVVLPRTELDGLRLGAVDDPVPGVRVRAWLELLAVDEPAARAAMTAGLGSGYPRIRMEAARRLGHDGVLLQLVSDPAVDTQIRRTALRSVSDPGVLLSAIELALSGEDDDLRRLALSGLAGLDGPRAVEVALRPWVDGASADWSLQSQEAHARVTARLLRRRPRAPPSEAVLLRFLAFEDLRELGLRGLAEGGTAAVVPRLRVLQHLDPGGAAELELVIEAIRQRLGGAGALALADRSGGGLALAEVTSGELSLD